MKKFIVVIVAVLCTFIATIAYVDHAYERNRHGVTMEVAEKLFPRNGEGEFSSHEPETTEEADNHAKKEWVKNFARTFDDGKALQLMGVNEEVLKRLRVANLLLLLCLDEMDKPESSRDPELCKVAADQLTEAENEVSKSIVVTNAAISALKKRKTTSENKLRIFIYEGQIAAYERNSVIRERLKKKSPDVYRELNRAEGGRE